MDALRQWAMCLITAGVAGAFVMAISPRGSMDKTVRAVIGVFTVAVICMPLTELELSYFSIESFAAFDDCEVNTDELNAQLIASCQKSVELQIKSAAKELGADIESVEAELSVDSDGCIIIHEISIKIANASSSDAVELSDNLEKKLGVAVTVNTE